jgi:hypothetical protein
LEGDKKKKAETNHGEISILGDTSDVQLAEITQLRRATFVLGISKNRPSRQANFSKHHTEPSVCVAKTGSPHESIVEAGTEGL